MSSWWDGVFRWSGRRVFPAVLWLCVFGTCASQEDFNSPAWLSQFGYLPKPSADVSTIFTAEMLSEAISEMQRFYNLEVTGQMDPQTIAAMKRPRCGVRDNDDESGPNATRRKRDTHIRKWEKTDLTYSIQNHVPRIGESETHEAIRKAFAVWEKATPLTFKEIPYEEIRNKRISAADIMIYFDSGKHRDCDYPFDGSGGVLAHAFFPEFGDMHFDAAERWTVLNQDLADSINVFIVAVHELGHSLGLSHSSSTKSIMFPSYQWQDEAQFKLSKGDIERMQNLYGTPLEQCFSGNGVKYRGTAATTFSGKTCQSWAANTPHSTGYTPENSAGKGLDSNYCRNPDGDVMPWCFTTDPNTLWEYCKVPVCAAAVQLEVPCYSCNGRNYRGTVARTSSGKTCQSWSAQTPHQHTRTPGNHPRKGLDSNYCRNPDNEKMPWCYTTDSEKRWEYCDVPKCDDTPQPELNCYNGDGIKFRGEVDKTITRKTCQSWSAQTPHSHDRTPENYPDTGLENNNYCRNPDGEKGPWCYTTDPDTRWEYCPVSTCYDAPGPAKPCYTGDGRHYRGTVASTTSDKTCQDWSAQTPHKHDNTPNNFPCKGLDNNYCRNPDGEERPWCYTTDSESRWEFCDVPTCV